MKTIFLTAIILTSAQLARAGVILTWESSLPASFCDATLVQDSNGVFYGTTVSNGSVFALNEVIESPILPGFALSNLLSLTPEMDVGTMPLAGVALSSNGMLYAATSIGATTDVPLFEEGMGALFSIPTDNSAVHPSIVAIHRFGSALSSERQPLDGASPRAALVIGPDNFLYGTTYLGGSNGYASTGLGFGTVFKTTTNGATFTELHSFSGLDGANPTALTFGSGGILYGVTEFGGSNTTVVETNGKTGYGTIFSMTTNGALTTLYSFGAATNVSGNALDGSQPNQLILGSDGYLYGTTQFGGSNTAVVNSNHDVGYGTIFRISTNGGLTVLYSFGAVTNINGFALDGANPLGPLVQGPDGNFFGTTQFGGPTNVGTVFRITPQGTLTTLVAFQTNGLGFIETSRTGWIPHAGLTLGRDKYMYGTTYTGATILKEISSSAFRLGPGVPLLTFLGSPTIPAGATYTFSSPVSSIYETSLQWEFDGTNLADGGNISGSASTNLTITAATLADTGTYTLVASNGAGVSDISVVMTVVPAIVTTQPLPGVILAGATNILSVGVDTVLPVTYQWRFDGTNLIDGGEFSGSTTSNLTISGAALWDTGIYSVVISNGAGAVTSGAFLLVVPFIALSDPANLTVMAGSNVSFAIADQAIYPIQYQWQFNGVPLMDGGNISGSGTSVLSISNAAVSQSGTYTVTFTNSVGSGSNVAFLTVISQTAPGCAVSNMHTFTSVGDGGHPNGLMLGHDGALYGTTSFGGSNSVPQGGGGDGTFFRFTTNGVLSTIYSFAGGADEADPSSPLVEDTNGLFYGTTGSAINNQYGTVFVASTNSTVTTLGTFYWTNGAWPEDVQIGLDGNLYGTVGPYTGSIYTVDLATTNFATALSFGGALGSTPGPGLTLGADGFFYGGTAANDGTIFRFDPTNDNLTTLYTFTNSINGSGPSGYLVQTSDGTFYGIAGGGTYGDGTIFKFSTNGQLTNLYSFGAITNWDGSALDGSNPIGGLALGPDGCLYGTTYGGGYDGDGTVFRVTTNGAFTTLVWLNDNIGAGPIAALALGPDGNFYGATQYGGSNDFGTIFQVIVPPLPPQIQAASAVGGMINLTWSAMTNRTYQVQYTSTLLPIVWQNLGNPMTATNNTLNFTDSFTSTQRFYRLIQY